MGAALAAEYASGKCVTVKPGAPLDFWFDEPNVIHLNDELIIQRMKVFDEHGDSYVAGDADKKRFFLYWVLRADIARREKPDPVPEPKAKAKAKPGRGK